MVSDQPGVINNMTAMMQEKKAQILEWVIKAWINHVSGYLSNSPEWGRNSTIFQQLSSLTVVICEGMSRRGCCLQAPAV